MNLAEGFDFIQEQARLQQDKLRSSIRAQAVSNDSRSVIRVISKRYGALASSWCTSGLSSSGATC